MTDQFTEFKKCIKWRKSGESWCGSFLIDKDEHQNGFCYSIVAGPGQAAQSAKPEIAAQLFDKVREYCLLHNVDFNSLINKKVLAKAKRK